METVCYDENSVLALISDGVLAVDRDLVIRQINPAACRILGIRDPAEHVGGPVSRVMEDSAFLRLLSGPEMQCSDLVAPVGRTARVECSFQCDTERSLFVCVMHDVSQQQKYEELLRCNLNAAALADTICEKQMQIVQEIASLLGETAVETQSAVQELKKALLPDRVEKNG